MQVHPAALPEAVLVPASIALLPPSVKAQVGAVVTSLLDVNVKVTVSALFALPSPLTVIAGVLRVGWVLSTVTAVTSVTADTAVPALPASSVKAIEKATVPSVSPLATSSTQVHALLSPSATVIELSAIAAPPEVNVQVGVWIPSDVVKLRVMSSPSFASPVLSTAIDTGVIVG